MSSKGRKTCTKVIVSLVFLVGMLNSFYSLSKFYYHQRTENLRGVVVELADIVAYTNHLSTSNDSLVRGKLSEMGYKVVELDAPSTPVPFHSLIRLSINVETSFSPLMKWAWIDETTQKYVTIARNATY